MYEAFLLIDPDTPVTIKSLQVEYVFVIEAAERLGMIYAFNPTSGELI